MIVFDSSTLILLAKTDLLGLFVTQYQENILIPERVKIEVLKEGKSETPVIAKLIEDKRIQVVKAKDTRQMKKLIEDFGIGVGESEALTLAIQEGAHLVATDDKNAIRACKLSRTEFITAIAVLVRAFENKLIDRDDALIKLHTLKRVGRYSNAIIEDATKQIRGDL